MEGMGDHRCRWQLQMADANGRCKRQVQMADANSSSEWQMQMTDPNGTCEWQVQMANANDKCKCQMQMQDTNARCKWRFKWQVQTVATNDTLILSNLTYFKLNIVELRDLGLTIVELYSFEMYHCPTWLLWTIVESCDEQPYIVSEQAFFFGKRPSLVTPSASTSPSTPWCSPSASATAVSSANHCTWITRKFKTLPGQNETHKMAQPSLA